MGERDNENGPRFVWTFPIVTRIQSNGSIFKFNILESIVDNRLDGDKESEDEETDRSSDYMDVDNTGVIEEEIQDIKNDSIGVFSQLADEDDVDEVIIDNNVFIPSRIRVDIGDSVRWVNDDSESHTVQSIDGTKIDSDELEPGDEYTVQFDSRGVFIYTDPEYGEEFMSGAVSVGDAEIPDSLPSESSPDPVLYDGERPDINSLSDAAEEKSNMDIGFDND
jgi:plastocyanin